MIIPMTSGRGAGKIRSLLVFVFSLFFLIFFSRGIEAVYINLGQTFSMNIGYFSGDERAFERYEDIPVPGIFPRLSLLTRLNADIDLPGEMGMKLKARDNDDFTGFLGLRYQGWGLTLGEQILRFDKPGAIFTRELEGLILDYAREEGLNLGFFLSQNRSLFHEVTFYGDDSPGPYFLGHKNIIEGSEEVFLDGERMKRGHSQGDGDYHLDCENGFIYFNFVVLSHEKVRVTYEYRVEDLEMASTFSGGHFSIPAGSFLLEGFVLRDKLPLDKDSVFEEAGYENLGWGISTKGEVEEKIRVRNSFFGTDYSRFKSELFLQEEKIELKPGEYFYDLSNYPVLYESEKIYLDEEKLTPYLDYVLDYAEGEIELFREFTEDSILKVKYRYIGDEIEAEEEFQGFFSRNFFSYNGSSFSHQSSFELNLGDYVYFPTLTPPPHQLFLGSSTEIEIFSGLKAGGDLDIMRDDMTTLYRPGVYLDWRKGPVESKLTMDYSYREGDEGIKRGSEFQGRLSVDSLVQWNLEFKKDIYDPKNFSPDKLKTSVQGTAGDLSWNMKYIYGEDSYRDQIETTLDFPLRGDYLRGNINFRNNLLFTEGVGGELRSVSGVFGRFSYNHPRYLYASFRGNATMINSPGYHSGSFDLRNEIGRDFGSEIMANYQLRLQGVKTNSQGIVTAQRSSTSHTFTYYQRFLEDFNCTLSYSYQHGETVREGKEDVSFSDQSGRFSLGYSDDYISLSLSYRFSNSKNWLGDEMSEKLTHGLRGEFDYQFGETLSFEAEGGIGFYDRERRRFNICLGPVWDLGKNLEIFSEYSFIRMAENQDHLYDAHILKLGFDYSF